MNSSFKEASNLHEKIVAAYGSKNHELCLNLIRESLKSDPSNVAYKLLKAACCTVMQIEVDETEAMLKQLIVEEPNNATAFYALGNCIYYKGELGSCQKYLEKAITLCPTGMQKAFQIKQNASIIMSAFCDADTKFEQDDFTAALKILSVIRHIDPTNNKVHERAMCIRRFYMEEIIKRIETEVNNKITENFSEIEIAKLASKAEDLIDRKQIGEAHDLIGKMEKLNPDAEAVKCLKGYAFYMDGLLDESIPCFNDALRINPNNSKAKNLFEKATKLDKLIKDSLEATKKNKDSEKALEFLNEALTVDPANSKVNQTIYLQRSYHNYNLFNVTQAAIDFKKFQESGIKVSDLQVLIKDDPDA